MSEIAYNKKKTYLFPFNIILDLKITVLYKFK